MIKSQQNYILLLNVKSLTLNRKDKDYNLIVSNHSALNKAEISNTFKHNYEYVYKLWPCKASKTELIKIEMFQQLTKQGETVLIKRGEASPIITYSQQGQKFQFYGSKAEKCVLVLKFRIQLLINVQNSMKTNALSDMNKLIDEELKQLKNQNKKQLQYLQNSNFVINSMGNRQSSKDKQEKEKHQNGFQVSNILKYSRINQESSSSRRFKTDSVLSNTKYLQKSQSIKIKQINSEPSNNSKEKNILHLQKQQNFLKAGNHKVPEQGQDVSISIRKRRQKYFKTQSQTNEERQILQNTSTVRDFIVRTKQYPDKQSSSSKQKNNSTARKIATRRRVVSSNKEVKTHKQQQAQEQINQYQSVQTPINFESSKSRALLSLNYPIDITLKKLKAVLYRDDPRYKKQLIIIHNDKKYQTYQVESQDNTTNWKNIFELIGLEEEDIIYFRVVSMQETVRCEEGQVNIKVKQFMDSTGNNYGAYLYLDKQAIGYLQFQYQKSKEKGLLPCKLTLSKAKDRNTISLPQIKKNINQGLRSNKKTTQKLKNRLFSEQKIKQNKLQLSRTKGKGKQTLKLSRCGSFSDKQLKTLDKEQKKSKCLDKIKQKRLKLRSKIN